MEPAGQVVAENIMPTFVRTLQAYGHARMRVISSRTLVVRQGDAARTFYYVERGLVRTYMRFRDGRRHLGLRLVRPGGVVGLDALEREKHPSTIQTVSTTTLLEFNFADVGRVDEGRPDVGRREMVLSGINVLLIDEAAALRNRLGQIAVRSKVHKVAMFLLEELTKGDLPEDLYQRDIAEFLSMAPETVCRVLTSLRRSGVLEPRGGLRVRDMAALRRLAGLPG